MHLKSPSLVLLLSGCLAIAFGSNAAPPASYSAGPTFGTVVDEATGAPIEGAVVVAQWILEGGAPIERLGTLVVREAVTDATGAFRIEGWGPIERPSRGRLDLLDPTVLIYKEGGAVTGYSNWGLARPGARVQLTQRDWLRNGMTIRLKDGSDITDPVQQRALVMVARTSLYFVLESSDCKWTHIPRAISLLERELARVKGPSASNSGKSFLTRTDCGSMEEFKRAYEEPR